MGWGGHRASGTSRAGTRLHQLGSRILEQGPERKEGVPAAEQGGEGETESVPWSEIQDSQEENEHLSSACCMPDAAAILLDEQNKRPCRKFLLTGQCDFGSNCRFSHMSERDLQELSIQVEEERRAREWPLDVAELPEGNLEDWLEKRAKRLSSAPSSRSEPIRPTIFQYPVGWPPVQELPPSLRAPPPGGWPLQPSVQWG
uniref:Zinc finger matrin-type 5 n=1 Tax=Equus caballus TaxID=9796 RepID=A0A9L0RQV0_HORSE